MKGLRISRQHHYLKTETEYFQAIAEGDKKFEIRKNDRDFRVYDILYLEEVVNGVKTGRVIGPFEIGYILHGGKYGIEKDHCVINW